MPPIPITVSIRTPSPETIHDGFRSESCGLYQCTMNKRCRASQSQSCNSAFSSWVGIRCTTTVHPVCCNNRTLFSGTLPASFREQEESSSKSLQSVSVSYLRRSACCRRICHFNGSASGVWTAVDITESTVCFQSKSYRESRSRPPDHRFRESASVTDLFMVCYHDVLCRCSDDAGQGILLHSAPTAPMWQSNAPVNYHIHWSVLRFAHSSVRWSTGLSAVSVLSNRRARKNLQQRIKLARECFTGQSVPFLMPWSYDHMQ